jgi:hypothetical protein
VQTLWDRADYKDRGVFDHDETIRVELDGAQFDGGVRIALVGFELLISLP